MAIIFANVQATGKWAMGSTEPLGTPSDFAESTMKIEVSEDMKSVKTAEDGATAKASDGAGGYKRPRSLMTLWCSLG